MKRPVLSLVLRRSICALSISVVVLLAADTVEAQPAPSDGVPAEPVQRIAEPGAIVVVPLRIRNVGPEALDVQPAIDLPDGWLELSPGEALIPLDGAGEVTMIVSFRVPDAVALGSHLITAVDVSSGVILGRVEVVIEATESVLITIRSAPEHVHAGADYEIAYQVQNDGTIDAVVDLTIENNQQTLVRLQPERLVLPPGAVSEVTAMVSTRSDYEGAYRVELHATSLSAPASHWSVSAYTRAIHADAVREDALPVTVTLGGASVEGDGVGLLEINSSIRNRERNTDFGFLVRIPSSSRGGIFPGQDRYQLRYSSPHLEARLGDDVYSLSRLTEPGRAGFGGRGAVSLGPLSFGAHYMRVRHGLIDHGQVGAQIGLTPIPELTASVQYFRIHGWQQSEIGTFQIIARPLPGHRIEAEAGTTVDGSGGRAIAISATGYERWLSYQVLYQDVEFAFGDRLNPARTGRLNLVARPTRWLRFQGSWHSRAEAGHMLPIEGIPERRVETLRVGTGLRGQIGGLVTDVFVGHISRTLEQADTDIVAARKEVGLEFRGRWRLGRFDVDASMEAGQWNSIDADPARYARLNARGRLDLGGHEHGITLRTTLGPTVALPTARDQSHVGWYSQVDVGGRSHVRVDARYSTYSHMGGRRAIFGQARIEQGLLNGSSISLTARTFTSWSPERVSIWEVGAAYSIPVFVPLPRASGPQLAGRVVDAETGAGIPGAVVFVGTHSAETENDGVFRMSRPPSGTYTLRVDRLSIGVERLPSRDAPTELSIDDDSPGPVIPVVRRAGVSGSVLVDDEGLRNAVVEIDDGSTRFRSSTSNTGHFSFIDLPPGRWTVVVSSAPLPAHYEFEERSIAVDLEPGMQSQLVFEAAEKLHGLRVTDGGVLRPDGTDRAPGAGQRPLPVRSGLFGVEEVDPHSAGFTWVLGSYSASEAAARRIVERYRAEGYRASVLTASYEGRVVYRVAVGFFDTRSEALQARSNLPKDIPRGTWLLILPQ